MAKGMSVALAVAGFLVAISASSVRAGVETQAQCAAAELKAAGKHIAGVLKAYSGNLKKPDPAKLAEKIAKESSKYAKALGKLPSPITGPPCDNVLSVDVKPPFDLDIPVAATLNCLQGGVCAAECTGAYSPSGAFIDTTGDVLQ
jgi:hypothetical protein